jgi:hypothetical protein
MRSPPQHLLYILLLCLGYKLFSLPPPLLQLLSRLTSCLLGCQQRGLSLSQRLPLHPGHKRRLEQHMSMVGLAVILCCVL